MLTQVGGYRRNAWVVLTEIPMGGLYHYSQFGDKNSIVMAVDWKEVSARRISEKTQEIFLYCAQKKSSMTSRSFDLARLSFSKLLDNIVERNPRSSFLIDTIRRGMDQNDECIAFCTKNQAASLARGVVYNYIGDDLDLYPVTAEKKLLRAKVRKMKECDIPIDEMTTQDIIYVVSAIAEGENFSPATMRSVFEWFIGIGMDPIQARVFSFLFIKRRPLSLKSLPQQSLFASEYKKAAKALVANGYICEYPGDLFCINEITIS